MSDENIKREQLIQLLQDNHKIIMWIMLAVVIFLSLDIRHANLSSLKDISNGKYIAADLDAFLFYRYGEYILDHGTHIVNDAMRFYPYGEPWDMLIYHQGFPYFLAYLYKFVHLFNNSATYDFVYVIYPAIALGLTLLVFFLLAQSVFGTFTGLIATAALGFSPSYLFRTMVGVADHDAIGMFMLILSIYFYMLALKQENKWLSVLFGFITGISTVFMVAVWPGSGNFLYLILGGTTLVQIALDMFHEKDYFSYTAWVLTFIIGLEYLKLIDITQLLGSTTTEIIVIAFGTGTVYYLLFEKDLLKKADYLKSKLPSGITALLLAIVLGVVLISAIEGPFFLTKKVQGLYIDMVQPWGKTRWQLTVAEQHQPYVVDWYGQMGKYYVIFFLIGSIYLFYELVKPMGHHLKKLQNYYLNAGTLTALYAAFIFCFTYSRYSPDSTFNGINTLSIWMYLGSLIIFIIAILGVYLYVYYQNKHEFYEATKQLNKIYLLIFVWFFFMLIGARGAIRLVFNFTPITALLFGYFAVKLFELSYSLKEQYYKIPAILIIAFFILSPVAIAGTKGVLAQYFESSREQAKNTGSPYNQQWQLGMEWVRKNTPTDAVFAHWWDYGYWVQTGGGRATVTDGGNEHGWWNYQIGRYLLTGQNETQALEVLAAHNATNFLIVSDDIGKYTAFSSIGGDENYDRYSWINPFTLNPAKTQETRNSTVYLYEGQYPLDDDLQYNGKFFPKMASGIGGIFVPLGEIKMQEGNETVKRTIVLQPKAAVFNNLGQRTDIPIECIFVEGQFVKFNEPGLKGCFRIIPSISGDKQNMVGAGLYVSEEGVKALWTNLYLFDQKNPDFPTPSFELAYDDSKAHDDNHKVPLLLYNGRLVGPMRIWKINYPKNFTLDEKKRQLYVGFEYENPAVTKV